MNRYAGLNKNDFAAGEGVCVTLFTQGCARHCPDCHNPETWDFNGGKEFTQEVINEIIEAIGANNIQRNFCVMGGEPLNIDGYSVTKPAVDAVRAAYPDIKIYVWTGGLYEDVIQIPQIKELLEKCDYLIDGPYIQELRDVTLKMRGSRNQRIINLKTGEII